MVRILWVLLAFWALWPAPRANAAEFASRDDAVKMAKRVQDMFHSKGPEATFKAITARTKEFVDRDLYAYVYGLDGVVAAHGGKAELVGKDLIDFQDENGKFAIRDMIELAQGPGKGWVDYRWENPGSGRIEDKSAYVEKMGNYFVGVGVYLPAITAETVSIMAGSPTSGDTSLLAANDLAAVLSGRELRVLPVAGSGGPQNIRDVLESKVDIALVQLNLLNSFRKSDETLGRWRNEAVYIARLYNEEVHIIAQPEISSVAQLNGLKVNLDTKGSGTSYVMRDVFKRLGIKVQEVYVTQAEALERMRTGEIAATALSTGKPAQSLNTQNMGRSFHFLPVPLSGELASDYLPSNLTHEDYPYLIPEGQRVGTVSSSVILICFNLPKSHERYRRIQKFVDIFFSKIGELQKAPHQAKWNEVNLAAKAPGWPRFAPAEAWVAAESAKAPAPLKARFKEFLAVIKGKNGQAPVSPQEAEQMFREFLLWSKAKDAKITSQYR